VAPNFADELLEFEKSQVQRVEKARTQAEKDIEKARENTKKQVEKAELQANKKVEQALEKAAENAKTEALMQTKAFKAREKNLKQQSQKNITRAVKKCFSAILQ